MYHKRILLPVTHNIEPMFSFFTREFTKRRRIFDQHKQVNFQTGHQWTELVLFQLTIQLTASLNLVLMIPGAMQFTLIPIGPQSEANAFVMPRSAVLETE